MNTEGSKKASRQNNTMDKRYRGFGKPPSLKNLNVQGVKRLSSKVSPQCLNNNRVRPQGHVDLRRNLSAVQNKPRVNEHIAQPMTPQSKRPTFSNLNGKKANKGGLQIRVPEHRFLYDGSARGTKKVAFLSPRYIAQPVKRKGFISFTMKKMGSFKAKEANINTNKSNNKKANLIAGSLLVSIEELTQSDYMQNQDDEPKRKTRNPVKPINAGKEKAKTNINNLLCLIKSDKKLAKGRKQLEVR